MGLFTGIIKKGGIDPKKIEEENTKNKIVGDKSNRKSKDRVIDESQFNNLMKKLNANGDKSFLTRRRYPFDETSMKRLKTCHPHIQQFAMAGAQILPLYVVTGTRDPQEQLRLMASGRSKAKPNYSKHNITPSMAIDLAPYIDGKLVYDDRTAYLYSGMLLMIGNIIFGEGYIISGGPWNDPLYDCRDHSISDPLHFEISDKFMGNLKKPYPSILPV